MGKTKRKQIVKMSAVEVHEYQTKFYRKNTVIQPRNKKPAKYKTKWSDDS